MNLKQLLENPPALMGIVNVTPDSFSDGGEFLSAQKAITHGEKLAQQGAAILDIGGESTRPNATPITIDKEINRITPVIKGLVNAAPFISADTRHTQTMRAAINAGANFINDVGALCDDGAIELLAKHPNIPICLMHMQGNPATMQTAPHYENVVREVYSFLERRINACVQGGIAHNRIIIDVGIGFGKTPAHNIELLRNISQFKSLGVPILIGASRKSFIAAISGGGATSSDRLAGSIVAATYAAAHGADILRVHDVAQTAQGLAIQKTLA